MAIGKEKSAIMPAKLITMAITTAKRGLSIKNLENIV
jgi:hypothetical protein